MTETINGLLTVKPGNEPELGAIKTFTWQTRKSQKTGNSYIKIKLETEEYGGKPCRILSAQQTDYKDAHGNKSFNVEIEPVNGKQVQLRTMNDPIPTETLQGRSVGITGVTRDDYWNRKLEHEISIQPKIIRQHSQNMAIQLLTLKGQLGQLVVEDLSPAKLRQLADYFDNDVLNKGKIPIPEPNDNDEIPWTDQDR